MPRGSKEGLARFAEAYAMTDDPVKAAEMCGYPPGQSFSSNAHKRARRGDVQAMVEVIKQPVRAKVAAEIEINLKSLIAELTDVQHLALKSGQYAAAVTAIKEKAVLAGIRVERSEWGQPGEFEILERMSADELRSFIAGDIEITSTGEIVRTDRAATGDAGSKPH